MGQDLSMSLPLEQHEGAADGATKPRPGQRGNNWPLLPFQEPGTAAAAEPRPGTRQSSEASPTGQECETTPQPAADGGEGKPVQILQHQREKDSKFLALMSTKMEAPMSGKSQSALKPRNTIANQTWRLSLPYLTLSPGERSIRKPLLFV